MGEARTLIDGSGYGLFFNGFRVELTKDQLKKCLADLDLERRQINGRTYVRAITKKTGRGTNSAGLNS